MAINKPENQTKNWDESFSHKKNNLFEILKRKTNKLNPNPELIWNRKKILKDLAENHVKIEENKKMLGSTWKIVHIDLPAIWEFKWFKFDYFISDKWIKKADFESNRKYRKASYSTKEISELLNAMNKYMEVFWIETDRDIDYEDRLKSRKSLKLRCEAWDCLKAITWLNRWYWLKGKVKKNIKWEFRDERIKWICSGTCCNFDCNDSNETYQLFLRLSD